MIHKFIIILLIATFHIPTSIVFAQKYSVRCKVIDTNGLPEVYATCRIFSNNDTTKAVRLGVTTNVGIFETTLPDVGHYTLYISTVGKELIKRSFSVDNDKPVADLGTLTSKSSDASLDNVVIVAQKPLISKKTDRIAYDVQADESSRTNTIIETLRKVPMVAVDAENKITVNGSSNFKIFKNGRPSNSYTNNAKDILTGIPASMVKRIEVITEPGAKHDAEGVGAIINIVMIENPVVKGVMGTARFSDDTNGRMTPSLWGTSQIGKIAFSLNGNFVNMNERCMTIDSEENLHYIESGNSFNSKSQRKGHGFMNIFGGEASYDIDSLNLLTAEFNGFMYDVKSNVSSSVNMTDAAGNRLYSYTQSSFPKANRGKSFSLDGNLNYQHLTRRPGEIIGVGYLVSTTHSNDDDGQLYSDTYCFPLPYTKAFSNTKTDFIEHTFQFDYTRPFGKIHKIELGSKYILRDNNSTGFRNYVDYQTENTDFSHTTNIGALYAQYNADWKQWSFRAGTRYECSYLKAKFHDDTTDDFSNKFNDITPSAVISWRASMASSFSMSYSSRINRPGITYLNPAVSITPTTLSYGNPDLSSVRNNSLKLTYMLMKQKVVFNASAGYDWSSNGIATLTFVDENGFIRNTFDNTGKVRLYSINSYVQWSPRPKTRLILNATISNDTYKQNNMRLRRWKKSVYANLTQKLPWNISGELMVMHMDLGTSSVYSYTDVPFKYSIVTNATLHKSLLKEERLTISLSAITTTGDSGMKIHTHIVNGEYLGQTSIYQHNVRALKVSIAYRFGTLNTSVKRTAKNIENDDMIGGKSPNTSGSGTEL